MVSLTRRIDQIKQPYGGFISKYFYNIRMFDDGEQDRLPTGRSTQAQLKGLIVDYLVRVLLGESPENAFRVSIMGADMVSESIFAKKNLSLIADNPTDDESITAAYHLVRYDVVVRRGAQFYQSKSRTNLTPEDFVEIRTMILRTVNFFNDQNQDILDMGITFEGGYNNYVSSADADFISQNTLWDLKTSSSDPTSKDSLQLLGYYLLGLRSKNDLFKQVDTLGIYNPRLNISYTIQLSEIPYNIPMDAGYRLFGDNFLSLSLTNWILKTFSNERLVYIIDENRDAPVVHKLNHFDVDDFPDGTHKISKDDYWTFSRDRFIMTKQPEYPHTKQIYLLKNQGYVMFISENHNGKIHIMNGGSLKRLDYSIDYYYENIPKYVSIIQQLFGNYFDFMTKLSREILQIWYSSDKSSLDMYDLSDYSNIGRIHGSIVDINYYNHISVDFYSGKLTLYNADNMSGRDVYPSIKSFIEYETPNLMSSYERFIDSNSESLLRLLDSDPVKYIEGSQSLLAAEMNDDVSNEVMLSENLIDSITPIFDSDTSMYSQSGVLKKLQRIFTDKHIVIWVDLDNIIVPTEGDKRWLLNSHKNLK